MNAYRLWGLAAALMTWGCAEGNNLGGEGGSPSSEGGAGGSGGGGGEAGAAGGAIGGGGGSGGVPPVCEETPCKLVAPQCGCPDGNKCSVNNQGDLVCAAEGQAALGEECDGSDPCIAGLICVVTKSTAPTVSTCMKFCEEDIQCKMPGGLCVFNLNDGSGNPIEGASLCTQNCDPVTNTGCPVAQTSCQAAQEAMGMMKFFTFCTGAGLGGQGATCTTAQDCQAGFGCFNVGMESQCLKWCNVQAATCPSGTACQIPDPAITIDTVAYGACI
jgi:hypothetical protein